MGWKVNDEQAIGFAGLCFKFTFVAFVLVLMQCCCSSQAQQSWSVDLSGEWKFKAGDDESYALPQFDDSKWEELYAPALWDGQGYADYDGFGWYRKRFFVPKELKGRDLVFEHGGVDDDDWVYINGVKVGEGKGCYIPRSYIIPSRLIRFGELNLIAVRIYDGAMGGGLARGPLRVRVVNLNDRISVEGVSIIGEFNRPQMTLRVAFVSKDGKPHKPKAYVSVTDYFMRKRLSQTIEPFIKPGERSEVMLQFNGGDSKDYRVLIELSEGKERLELFYHILSDITVGARLMVVLSGDWEMLLPPDDELRFPPEGKWQYVKVPMLSWGGWGEKNHRAWFRKEFVVPSAFAGKRIVLHFEAVAHHAVVFVNGRKVGEHLGGFEPFEFDVTDAVRLGEKNELLVGVTDWIAGLVEGVEPPKDPEKLPKDSMLIPYGTRPHSRKGIWDDVFLYARSPIFIADAFVMTSVRNETLTVITTLRNDTDKDASVELAGGVYDGETMKLMLPKRTVTVKANGTSQAVIVVPDVIKGSNGLKLWFPHDPHLYRLNLRLSDGGQIVDELNLRFGFREIWIDGINYRLNGRIFRLRGLGCPPTTATREEIRKYYIERLKANFTLVRFHMQPRQKHFYEIADEVGMCVKDESAFYCAANVYALADERLWLNLRKHIEAMVMRSRNHPSLLIWSVENEILHCGGMRVKGTDERIYGLGELIKQLDPTRPIEFEGDGDVNGRAETINIHYPREFGCHDHNLFPNDAYWLGKEGNDRWPRELVWKKDKPIIIGEFCYYPYSRPPGGVSIFLGDSVYVSRDEERKAHLMGVKMLCDGMRQSLVAGLNPWVDDLRYSIECLKPIVAFMPQYDKNFFSSEAVEREITVLNDTLHRRKLTLVASVRIGNSTIAQRTFAFDMDAGELRTTKFSWRMPNVKDRTSVSLRLLISDGANVVFEDERKLWLFPREQMRIPNGLRVALFDPHGETERALSQVGLALKAVKALEGVSKESVDLLLIGKGGTETEAFKQSVEALRKFVRDGGIVFCFEQSSQPTWLPINLRLDERRPATMVHICYATHPLLSGMQSDDFMWWRNDHIVARSSFVKPSQGAFRILLECGGKGGLRWTPLVEILYGDGSFIMCQLEMTSKLTAEPVAQMLLRNLMQYAVSFKPAKRRRLAVAVASGSPIQKALSAVGAVYDDISVNIASASFDRYGLLLIDRDMLPLLKERMDDVRSFVANGGIVWVHNPKDTDVLRTLIPQITAVEQRKFGGRLVKCGNDELLYGIGNSDLFWYREDCWYADWEGRGSGFIGEPAYASIELKNTNGVKVLTNPCALIKAKMGKGFILVDTLNLFEPPNEVRDKAMRILATLLTNMQALP
jgi:hypothetical protein